MQRVLPVTLALLTSFGSMGWAATPLGYHLHGGDTLRLLVRTKVTVPVLGDQKIETEYGFRVSGVSGDLNHLQMTIAPMDLPSGPLPAIDGSCDLTSEGRLQNLQSPGLAEPRQAPFVKNAATLFIPLPDRPVEFGAEWTGRSVLYMPPQRLAAKMGLRGLGLPEKVAIDGTYRFRSIEQDYPFTHEPVALVEIRLQSAAGEPMVVSLEGHGVHSLKTGACLGGTVMGFMRVKKLGVPITLPMAINTAPLD